MRRRDPNSGTKSDNRPKRGLSVQGMASNAINAPSAAGDSPQLLSSERTGWAMSPEVGSPTLWTKYSAAKNV